MNTKITQEKMVERLAADKPLQRARLVNWAHTWGNRLHGDVRDHPQLGDEDEVVTTPWTYLNETLGIAVTKNTIYLLSKKRKYSGFTNHDEERGQGARAASGEKSSGHAPAAAGDRGQGEAPGQRKVEGQS